MFQIGLFTTHLPYIIIIALYAGAILFNTPNEEVSFRENESHPEQSCFDSYYTYPQYFKKASHQTCGRSIHCNQDSLHHIPGRRASTPPITFTKLKFLKGYINKPAHTFLSNNIPNRAPPAGILLSAV